jgi:capsule synthesis protein PGA_cap
MAVDDSRDGGGSEGDDATVPTPEPALPSVVPQRRRPLINRLTIIIAALVGVLVAAGGAGATTFLAGDDATQPRAIWSAGAPVPSSEAPTSSPPAPAPASQGSISMSATGDIVMGMAPGRLPPDNGKGFFDQVRDLLSADLQMGNLEQTITVDTGVAKCASGSTNCHAFRTPPPTAQNLKDGGFHLVNMANNHAYDFGPAGYKNTQKALDSVGVRYTGFPGQVTVVDVKGTKVAVVGFSSYREWSNLCSDLPESTKIITAAAGEADIVVVQVHMGAEGSAMTRVRPGTETFLGEDRCDPIKFSHTVIDAGADLVVGHGPHVVRGMEFYKGRLIAYSLGNFSGYGGVLVNDGVLGVSAVIRVNVTRDGGWAGGTVIATTFAGPGLPKPDPKKQAITLISSLTKQDFPQTGAKIAADGSITQ